MSAPIAENSSMVSANAANANNIKKCELLTKNFQHTTATTVDRQKYADCVNFIYPSEQLDPLIIILIKLLIILSIAFGAVKAYREKCFNLTERLMTFFVCSIGFACVFALVSITLIFLIFA